MKKFVALLLAMLLVLVNVAVLADGDIPIPNTDDVVDIKPRTAGGTNPNITKTYTTTGSATDVYPIETLKFTVTPANTSYPEITIGYDGTVEGQTKNTYKTDGQQTYNIPLNIPAASAYSTLGVGMYHYTVKEVTPDNPSQSAAYNTENTTFNVDVYVSYVKDPATGLFTTQLERIPVVYSGDPITDGSTIPTEKKQTQFKNTYVVGSLEVSKKITGSLAKPDKVFSIKVTLRSSVNVANKITIDNQATSVTGDVITDEETGEIYIADTWTGNKVITFTAVGGQKIIINNIPKNVTYSVEETEIDRINPDNNANQLKAANNTNAYAVTGEVATATIAGNTTAEKVEITNKKDITIPTGIALDTVPYILILAVALFGVITLAARRREEY